MTLSGTVVHRFSPSSVEQLDRVRYWLGFDRLCVVVEEGAPWSLVYLTADGGALTTAGPHITLDAARFSAWLDLARVDHRGRLRRSPSFAEAQAAVAGIPLSLPSADPVHAPRAPATGANTPPRSHLDSPCDGCAAPCCDHIVVPLTRPSGRAALDAVSSLLETPGLSVGVSDDGAWALTAETRCTHFDADTRRCGVYGQPERPGFCRTYSPWACEFRKLFSGDPTSHFLSLTSRQFEAVRDIIPLSRGGSALGWPSRSDCSEHLAKNDLP